MDGRIDSTRNPAAAARRPAFLRLLAVAVALLTARATPAGAADLPKPLDGPKTIPLPAPADSVCVGGGGRYLLLRLDKVAKLAVYDVVQDKIKGYVPLGSTDTLVAAGADKLVLVARDKGVIQRWKIDPPQKEQTSPLLVDQVDALAMGHSSQGPVLAVTRDGPVFLSLATLKQADVQLDGRFAADWRPNPNPQYTLCVAASADGQAFAGWYRGTSPSGVRLMRVQGDTATSRFERDNAGVLLPSWDGSQLFTGNGVYSSDLKPLGIETFRGRACVPAYRPGYFLTVVNDRSQLLGAGPGSAPSATVSIYTSSDRSLLVQLPPMPELTTPRDPASALPWHERVFLVPQHERLITLAESRDKLIARPFDMMDTLDKAGIDYLFVDTVPVTTADPGKKYSYRMYVQSKKGGVKFTLDSAPEGMKLSNDGLLTWKVPANAEPGPAGVIISVEDSSGQSVFHTFNVDVTGTPRPGGGNKRIDVGSAAGNAPAAKGAPPVVRAVKRPAKGGATAQTDR